MALFIIDKAICRCSKSSTPSILQVTSQTLVRIQKKLQATENDKPVIPFGFCNNDPKTPCVLSLQKWEDITSATKINGQQCLLETSYIMCSLGGKVTIANHTQVHLPVQ